MVGPGGFKKTALNLISEKVDLLFRQGQGQLQPGKIKGRLVEIEQAVDQKGIVVELPGQTALPVPIAPKKRAGSRIIQLGPNKIGSPFRRGQITFFTQHLGRPSKGADHVAVPGGDDLVVEMRPRPLRPHQKELLPGAFEQTGQLFLREAETGGGLPKGMGDVEDIFPGKLRLGVGKGIARLKHPIMESEDLPVLLAEAGDNLLPGPEIKQPLAVDRRISRLAAVGILRRIKAPFRAGQIPQDIIENILGDIGVKRVMPQLESFEITDRELSLVVEHLFKWGTRHCASTE